jgi:ectoine hydroxylase-related dioxygenase (phytanoyl-CoA dioxygenase family)
MLSLEQIRRYSDDGVLFPIPVLNAEETRRFREAFRELEERAQGPQKYVAFSHLFFPWVYELATHPLVVEAAADLLGADVLVDSSLFLCKHACDGTFAPWHQDGTYSMMHTAPSVSAWIALTDSTCENGCMRVVPRTHCERYAHHIVHDDKTLFDSAPEVEVEVDERQAVDIELRAGEMSLHHSSIIHGSQPNHSPAERLGFIVRFVTPEFRARKSTLPVVRALGSRDLNGLPLLPGPPTGELAECFRRWRTACPPDMPRGGVSPKR